MLPSAQLIIIELGYLDICNRNMRKFVVKYNQMECSCKRTSCFGNKMILDCWLFDCVVGEWNDPRSEMTRGSFYPSVQ